MPYIKQEKRNEFDKGIAELAARIETEGDFNYVITKFAYELIDRIGENYKNLAMCVSAMENAKLEFYRRRVAPYEDTKIIENGDI